MKTKPRMNVQDIAEVLVAEMEDFKKVALKLEETGKQTKEVAQEMEHKLQQMKSTHLKIDTTEMKGYVEDIKQLRKAKKQIPEWIVLLLVLSIFGAVFGWGFAFKESQEKKEVIEQYQLLYQEYEKVTKSVQ